MESSEVEAEGGNIDSFNDETFGEGATTDDWEQAHFNATTAADEAAALPLATEGKSRLVHTLEEVEQDQEVVKQLSDLRILWPKSPQETDATGSIWSSPKLPSRSDDAKLPSMPLGTKVISLEELEREITESSSSLEGNSLPLDSSSLSPSHQSQPTLSPPSHSPAHMTPPPPGLTPPPQGIFPGQLPPHPIHAAHQPHPLQHAPPPHHAPPMPHPHFLRGGMQHQFPWLMRGGYMPPPHPSRGAFPPNIPPPSIPLLGPHMRPPIGQYPPHAPPTAPHHPLPPGMPPPPHSHPPLIPGPPPGHPLFYHHQPPPEQALRKSKRSEYLDEMRSDGSGFMTQKEKEWVIRVQLIQLQTHDPDNEDYYYQNYKNRQALRQQQSKPSSDAGSLETEDTPSPSQTRALPTITLKEYRPKEFQGALGKLSVSSIAAPRKMIDAAVVSEPAAPEAGVKDSHRKKRQTLIIIEKIFDSVLLLEEVDRKSQSLAPSDTDGMAELRARRDAIVDKAFCRLKLKTEEDASSKNASTLLQMIMTFRKGKRVISRLLPFLKDDQALVVVRGILCHLPAIIKKDSTDLVLPELTTPVLTVVSRLSLPLLLTTLSCLLDILTSAAYVLRVCLNEFSGRVLKSILDYGSRKVSSSTSNEDESGVGQWRLLVKQLHTVLVPHEDKLKSKFPIAEVNLVQFVATLK